MPDSKDATRPTAKTDAGVSPEPSRARQRAAQLAAASGALFLVLLATVQLLEPEFDPTWRFVSEYELGDLGWIMRLGFACLALSTMSLSLAVGPYLTTVSGKIGRVLLVITSVAFVMTAVVAPDPSDAPARAATLRGMVHSQASTIAGLTVAVGALLANASLIRSAAWARSRNTLRWIRHLPWLAFIAMNAMVVAAISSNDGHLGPGSWIGWPTRVFVVTIAVWTISTAIPAVRINRRDA